MFRNDHQACQALRRLLGTIHLESLWTESGPSAAALRYRDADGGPLSSGERIMLLVAFDLWNGSGNLQFRDLLGAMDNRRAAEVFSLVVALNGGGQAEDQWLLHAQQQTTRSGETE